MDRWITVIYCTRCNICTYEGLHEIGGKDMTYQIETATAIYTGGGIYIYRGKLKNGLFFSSCDTWESIVFCNADTYTDEADFMEFYDQHQVEEITGKEYKLFFNKMLKWIIKNEPDGNYISPDLERRIIKQSTR